MCGIAGILGDPGADPSAAVSAMVNALRHRGPDGSGVWSDAAAGIGLGHRRLAILDLSDRGAQPMQSATGRYVISYNGEVYNHGALRRDLETSGVAGWRGHSDTEVLLAAIERWGLQDALARLNGMFAFALWDRHERTLALVRDRIGEKPLYVGWVGGVIAFASELKAFRRLPLWRERIDRRAVGFLLRFGFIPAPLSIQRDVFKLPPACSVVLSSRDCENVPTADAFAAMTRPYWNVAEVAEQGAARPLSSRGLALDRVAALLQESVAQRMEADVPVGALLSGGVDSSLVAALMQQSSSRPIRTFTIGFGEERYDEGRFAGPVARHIGSDHTEVRLTSRDALAIVPQLPDVYDEPFADASQIPTILVSRVARQEVTVALSGDGGDELFGGYRRYRDASRTWAAVGWWPVSLRRRVADGLSSMAMRPRPGWWTALRPHAMEAPRGRLAFRARRFAERIDAPDFDAYYTNLLSTSCVRLSPVDWPAALPQLHTKSAARYPAFSSYRRGMLHDQSSYLPDDILVKVDRASMSAGLELRVPLLDHRIVELSWRLPEAFLHRGAQGKALLRGLLYRYVPRVLVDRPKQGFEIPLHAWLRGPLRDWMLDLLDPRVLRQEGHVDPDTVAELVRQHLAGTGDFGFALWPVLMFQCWRAAQV